MPKHGQFTTEHRPHDAVLRDHALSAD